MERRRMVTRAGRPVRIEARSGDGGVKVLRGYGAVFYDAADPGTEYTLWEGCVERIMPGAFDRAMRERQDVRGLFNHDPSALLGRSLAGTLRLSVDAQGLGYEIDLPDTQTARDVAVSVERGDVTGSSFCFMAARTVWIEQPDLWIRQVEDVDLFDVGPVTFPAYESTSTGLRSADLADVQRELEEWRKGRAPSLSAGEWPMIRQRMLDVDLERI